MIIKTLYKRGKKNKIQQWAIEVEDDKFRSIEGFVDGTLTTSKWTTAKGKNIGKTNEVLPNNQALKQAEAKIKEKINSGGYSEDLSNIDDKQRFKPMLAHKYPDKKEKVIYPCYVQPKLDGIRCNPINGITYSREGKVLVTAPHIIERIDNIMGESEPYIIFDGELYNHKLHDDFNEIVSIIRTQKPTEEDLQKSKDIIQFHIYDAFCPTNPDLKFSERMDCIKKFIDNDDLLIIVETFLVNNEQELDAAFEKFLSEGYEGLIIRNNALYKQDRSNDLLKRKEWLDDEFTITNVIEGVGNRSGMMGTFELIDSRGEKFEADASGLGGYKAYKEFLENKDYYIDKKATVKYQNLTPDRQVPRFGKVVAIRDYE